MERKSIGEFTKKLRNRADHMEANGKVVTAESIRQAADLIDQQQAEIERLRNAMEQIEKWNPDHATGEYARKILKGATINDLATRNDS